MYEAKKMEVLITGSVARLGSSAYCLKYNYEGEMPNIILHYKALCHYVQRLTHPFFLPMASSANSYLP